MISIKTEISGKLADAESNIEEVSLLEMDEARARVIYCKMMQARMVKSLFLLRCSHSISHFIRL